MYRQVTGILQVRILQVELIRSSAPMTTLCWEKAMQSKQNLCLKLHVTSHGTHKQAVELVKIAFYVLRKKMWSASHNMIAVHCCIASLCPADIHPQPTMLQRRVWWVNFKLLRCNWRKSCPPLPPFFLKLFLRLWSFTQMSWVMKPWRYHATGTLHASSG